MYIRITILFFLILFNSHHGLGTNDLILSEAVVPSEYSYLDVNVFSTWAGPQHWKSQPERKEKEKVHQGSNSYTVNLIVAL